MYKETLRPRGHSAAAGILTIVGLMAGVLLLAFLLFLLNKAVNIGYTQYILYVLFIAAGVVIVRKRLTEYGYSLIGSELLFEKIVGNNVKMRETVRLEHVNALMKWSEYQRPQPGVSIQKMTFRASRGAYVLCYAKDGRSAAIKFHPSEKLAGLIEQALESIKDEKNKEPVPEPVL